MRAFLSHSSRNKAVVEQVAELVGGANVEMDSYTFDQGVLNVTAIQQSLKRSDLFVLFLTQEAVASKIVKYEALMAQELLARGIIERLLVICLDDEVFASADEQWKTFNFVRVAVSPQSIARAIQSALLVLRSKQSGITQPFVGRSKELNAIKETLIEPTATDTKAIYVSGNSGIGRRTFAKHVFQDIYPAVNTIFPEIIVSPFDGYEELFRKVLEKISPFATLSEKRTRNISFSIANDEGKASLIAMQLRRLLDARESMIFIDHGGLLSDSGDLSGPVKAILDKLGSFPHPTVIFVADRMVPYSRRKELKSIVYAPLSALERNEVRQLTGLLLRSSSIEYTNDQLEALTDLADGHPFNVAFMVQAVKNYTIPVFLADPSELTQLKRKRSSDFLQKIEFDGTEIKILSAMKDFTTLDFETITNLAEVDVSIVGQSIMRLIDFHIIEGSGDSYNLSSPLKAAVERDERFKLRPEARRNILKAISDSLISITDSNRVSGSMIETAILASLLGDQPLPELFAAFLLPSHSVWLARRRYDDKKYEDSIRFALSALDGKTRLSSAGKVEACRLLCLAATRVGQNDIFQKGIDELEKDANDPFSKSNMYFLLGFNQRMSGKLLQAEVYFRQSLDYSPDNFSALRELASIRKIRGDLTSAESFARLALQSAPDNAYLLDIMLSILINQGPKVRRANAQEIETLFQRLKIFGDSDDRSFYTTRRAEYEWKEKHFSEACKLIDEAVLKTTGIFSVHLLRAQIYLDLGNRPVAYDEIKIMKNKVSRDSRSEGQSNLRPLMEIEAEYSVAIGEFDVAKNIYRNKNLFSEDETVLLVKRVEYEQALKLP